MQVIRSNKPDYLNIKIRNSQLLTFIIYRINTYKQLSCQVISKSIISESDNKEAIKIQSFAREMNNICF